MARSNIRVLALDLDGTLTNDEKKVTPRTRAALDAAAAQGVTIVLASGRPTAGILPLAKELGLDKKGGCILSYNGGKIVDCATGETLYEKTLDPAVVPELCAFAAAQDVAVLTYNSEGIVCERDKDEWANKECFTTKLPMIHVDDLASYVDYPICKMLVTLDPARRDAVCAAGQQQFQGRVDLYPSSPFFIEAVPLGVMKDVSLGALLERMGLTRENLTGVRVVRAFDKEASEVERFENANDLLTRMQLHVGHISALMNPLTYVLINIAIVALLYVGSIEINVGGMASGDVIALVNYMNQILVELVKLANLIVQVSKGLACAGRVQAVLDTQPGMAFPEKLLGEVPTGKAGDAVRFDHLSLTYAGAGAPSLSDISFTAKQGQTIGVIGGTGSGKSSLVNLIPRFYDATEGRVEIMGRDVRSYPREALRGKVAVVMQKAQLFGGTIRSNLLWGRKNASDEELWQALETAQAAEFVRAKPLGLDEPVEQGGRNLSGGQKQRLTIARALVGRPDILILDDSASALDYATDAALRKALAALPGSLTVFIVSQRAASLQHADQILVLDDGHLVGIGTHDQLRQTCPVYEEIYESQFKKGDAQK